MHYIIYDTEFNQPQPKLYNANIKFKPNPISPFEIIEIGAVKVNENMEIVSTFQCFIKPIIYKRMSPIVMRKTKITKKDLKTGIGFPKVMKDFKKWIGDEYILCTWSNNDVRELKRNCNYHKLDCQWLDRYYDLQKYCTRLLGLPQGQTIGLKNALEAFGVPADAKLHRALEDALYTAKILIKISNEEMKNEMLKSLTKEE
jgi:inhibitor of KinA sporulation pathway (predicted exonuclease)